MFDHKMFFIILIIYTLMLNCNGKPTSQSKIERNNQTLASGGKIIFPDSINKRKANIKPRSNYENCIYDLCEDADNYPEEKIQRILRNSPDLQNFFDDGVSFTLENRVQDDSVSSLCNTMSKVMYPMQGKNINKDEKFIINVEGYKQGIFVETCTNNDSTCKFNDVFPSVGYKTICQQKYTRRRLMALNETDSKAAWDTFEFPSCCVCMLQKN